MQKQYRMYVYRFTNLHKSQFLLHFDSKDITFYLNFMRRVQFDRAEHQFGAVKFTLRSKKHVFP
jgi:hypothetical protein